MTSLDMGKIPHFPLVKTRILSKIGMDSGFFDNFKPQENKEDAFAFLTAVFHSSKLFQKDIQRAKYIVHFLLLYCGVKRNLPEITSLFTKNQALAHCKVKASHLVIFKIFTGSRHGSGYKGCQVSRHIAEEFDYLKELYRGSRQRFWADFNGYTIASP